MNLISYISDDEDLKDQNVFLKPFGMATYKLQGDLWAIGNGRESLMTLLSIADSWLKQLNVDHHDFNYFTRFHPRMS